MNFAKLAAEIWRDFQTDGVPASGQHNIPKADMRQWMASVQGALGDGNVIAAGWVTATSYAVNDVVWRNDVPYLCIVSHTSGASTEPGVGASWQTVWAATTEQYLAIDGSLRGKATLTPLNTDALLTASSTTGGFFADSTARARTRSRLCKPRTRPASPAAVTVTRYSSSTSTATWKITPSSAKRFRGASGPM